MNYSVIGNDVVPTITISNWEFAVRFGLFLLFVVFLYLIEETNKIFKRVDLIPLRERRMRLIRLLNQDRDEEIKRIHEEYDMKIRNLPPLQQTAEEEKYYEEENKYYEAHHHYNPVTEMFEWDENYPSTYEDYLKQQQQQEKTD